MPTRTHHLRFAFLLTLLTLPGLPLAPGCGDDGRPGGDCPATCPCSAAGCAEGWCGALIRLQPSCAEASPAVEVSVAGCLEPEDLVVSPGTEPARLVPCGAVPAGGTGSVVVRGRAVQWGPFDLTCPESGGLLYPVDLDCPAP
jgi:hypothetical protein